MNQALEYIIAEAIEQGKFPHYLKVYPRNAYIRREIHILMEELRIKSETDKAHPFFYYHYQGWESFDIKDVMVYPMILTITEESLKPKIKLRKKKALISPTPTFIASSELESCVLWNRLPEMVLFLIFSQLSWNDLSSCFLTCFDWSYMSDSPLLWKEKWSSLVESNVRVEQKKRNKLDYGKLSSSLDQNPALHRPKNKKISSSTFDNSSTTASSSTTTNTNIENDNNELAFPDALSYKTMVKNELVSNSNSLCRCYPFRHKHYSSYPDPEPCYIACHGSYLSSLRHAIYLFRSKGFRGEIIYNPNAL
jgi:hypothetical protein